MMLRTGLAEPEDGPPNFAGADDSDDRLEWEAAFLGAGPLAGRGGLGGLGDDGSPVGGDVVFDHSSETTADDDDDVGDDGAESQADSDSSSSKSDVVDAPGGRADCGSVLEDADGRSWYVARDEETIADICKVRAIDAAQALAANLRASHFLVGPKLTLKSKLKHHTRVLLTF
mmetsp:Transcript_2543/g.8533  ORF Transcript_2543/g.8533 Transcript_2543/m.8533 type:complete len:173 (-) Transcript_2543:529-1047(-)